MKEILEKIYRITFKRKVLLFNLGVIFRRAFGVKTIIYELSNDYFYYMFEPIYDLLKKDKRISIFFMCPKQLNFFMFKKGVSKNQLFPGEDSRLNPDMYISSEQYNQKYLPNSLKVQLFHGNGVYPHYKFLDTFRKYNIYFATGIERRKWLEERKFTGRIYNIGLPKTDVLFRIRNHKKTNKVLYIPHWTSYGSLEKFQESIIGTLAKSGARVIVKPHHNLYVRKREWKNRIKSECEKYTNIIFSEEPNNQALFEESDLLVTDIGSSVAFDYSILRKPLVIFNNPRWFKENRDYTVESATISAAFRFTSLKQLSLILHQLLNPDKKTELKLKNQRELQKKLIARFLYNPGQATKKAVSAIYRELNLKSTK